ncbi:MAG: HNH endonuclease [Candidatus Scalindua sp.]
MNGYYSKDTHRFEAEAKHYSECAEYSEYCFHNIGKGKGKRKRSPFSSTLKFEIFDRDKSRCYYGKRHKDELPPGIHLTIDHKIPYVDGGDDSFSNLVTACSECNSGKSHKVINDL